MNAAPERSTSRREGATSLLLGVLGLWPFFLVAPTGFLVLDTVRRLWQAVRWNLDQRLSVALAIGLCTMLSWPVLAPRRWYPRSPLVILAGAAAALALVFAGLSHALDSLLLLSCFLLGAWEAGRLILARLHLPGASLVEMALFRVGLGMSALSLAGLVLGLLARLEQPTTWALISLLLASAALSGWRFFRVRKEWLAQLREWIAGLAAVELGRVETACVGVALATFLAAFSLAVVPEVQSDAVRMHLAVARRFAESGKIEVLDQFSVSSWPLLAQVLYTLGLFVHDTISAKLLHTAAGLGLTLAAAAAAGKLAGRTGAIVAAALVATLPVACWLLGTAYVDLFAAFYALLATLAILNWQRTTARAWLPLAGAAAGSAMAAKLTAGGVSVGLCLAILLVGRRTGGLGNRFFAPLAYGLGGLVALGPWVARSAILTGKIPGAGFLLDALSYRRGPPPESLANLPGFGTGRSLKALMRLPWDLTFHTGLFGENMDGFAGVALLCLLPLIVIVPRTRAAVLLGVTTLVAALLWFFTAQYLRYLLPAVGLLAVLLGAGFAQVPILVARHPTWPRVATGRAYAGALAGSLVCAPMFFLSTVFFVYPGSLPVRMLAARQTPEQYLERRVASYNVLRCLDRTIRPGTPVVMLPDGPQLYSRARLISNMTGGSWILPARSADDLVARFSEHHVRYLILEAPAIPPSWRIVPLFQPQFLERHAQVLYTRNGVTLYLVGEGIGTAAPRTPRRLEPPRPPAFSHDYCK